MTGRILITGGAGFIGSHLAAELLQHGYQVRALDNLSPQVHGPERRRPSYLDRRVDLRVGDVRDPSAVAEALTGVDAVFHFAAAVGVGQSMYEIAAYTATNNLGTAVLMEALTARPVRKLVVASSMSLYGEGLYCDGAGTRHDSVTRTLSQLQESDWEPRAANGTPLVPIPTTEDKAPGLSSIYALSKYDQERMAFIVGRAYGIPTTALRFFNVYGPHQALSNPYTGVLAIFASRLLNDKAPLVFEDGKQMRDFVSVHDVTRACRLALESDGASDGVFNIGSGEPRSIAAVGREIAAVLGRDGLQPQLTGRYRMGDVRHCFASIERARATLGYEPAVAFAEGLGELAEWLRHERAEDRFEDAAMELQRRGLTI